MSALSKSVAPICPSVKKAWVFHTQSLQPVRLMEAVALLPRRLMEAVALLPRLMEAADRLVVLRRGLGEDGARVRRQRERGRVRLGAVPLQRVRAAEGRRALGVGHGRVVARSQRGAREVEHGRVARAEAVVRPHVEARAAEAVVHEPKHGRQPKVGAALRGDRAARLQDRAQAGVEGVGVQRRARADGVGRIDDDEIVARVVVAAAVQRALVRRAVARRGGGGGGGVCHKVERVAPVSVEPPVGVVTGRPQRGERLAHGGDHLLVDVDEVDVAHLLVPQHLPHGAAVAATDHEHAPHRPAGVPAQHGHVHQQLVVALLVSLGALHGAIEDEHAPECRRRHLDQLVRRPLAAEHRRRHREGDAFEPRVDDRARRRPAAPQHAMQGAPIQEAASTN
eukprot:CAMPEP_0185374592 /NCGR_PEP_ID=MMETSP1364-20130426/33655_1 /TAXON_ID=38817 /ORGANISM="Gephyrocapsa oceanica, Strain RCC1303" /LENGTH=394 /DNA_ID=CAMNT_0027975803 /DNA_START=94 /DNA_END=1275 /DNA_ORIENTATION=+